MHKEFDPESVASELTDGQAPHSMMPPDAAGAGLAPAVREHLGRKLRATYNELADKPQYLGDPAIPIELEYQLSRIERREVIHNQAVKAVESALGDILGDDLFADPKPSGR